MNKLCLLGVLIACLSSQNVLAVVDHSYSYTYDGIVTFVNQSASGNILSVGETVGASFSTAGSDYWTWASGAGSLWAPIGISDSGIRTGDLNWSLRLDGVEVDSGSLLGAVSETAHIAQGFFPSSTISFDELYWEYTLTSSTAASNIMGNNLTNGGIFSATYVAAVPMPPAIWLFGSGLLGMIRIARRKKAA